MPEKILVIDDDVEFANLLALLLSRKGYETEKAFGGVEGIEKAGKFGPSVILQDYMLPDYRGIDLLGDLRKKCPEAYVIIVTARGSEEVAVELMKSGASDYLKKPFEAEKLLTTIQNILKLKASETERNHLHREIVQQNQELMALNAFSNALISGMEPEEKCKSAMGIILKNLKVDLANLFDVSNGRTLKLFASKGSGGEDLRDCLLGKDVGLASYVAEIKKPAVVADFSKERRFKVPQELLQMGVVSALAVPMMLGDSVKGVLAVYTKEPRSFLSFDMKLLSSFANQVALARENARLADMMEGLRRQWQMTVDAVPDMVTLQDSGHTIIKANAAAAALAGSSIKDIIGQKCCWVFHSTKEPIPGCPVNEAIKTKGMATKEITTGTPPATYQIWAYPILDSEGNVEAVVEYAKKVKG